MYNYYVIEIQTNAEENGGMLSWGFADKLEAEDKFLQTREAANDSGVMIHTVMFITNKGKHVEEPACYVHPVPAPVEPGE